MDKCKSPGFDRHKFYFMNHSHFTNCIVDSFKFKYSIDIYLDDDHDAILSRIFYLQKREQSSIIIIIFIDNLIQKVKTTFKILKSYRRNITDTKPIIDTIRAMS